MDKINVRIEELLRELSHEIAFTNELQWGLEANQEAIRLHMLLIRREKESEKR